jgi:hypothetical protein
MENLEKLLNLFSQGFSLKTYPGTFGPTDMDKLYSAARKEFEALKAAGVEVKIEQVEKITVVKPKVRRGGARPRTKKLSEGNYQMGEPHR